MLNFCVYIFTAYAVSGSVKTIMGIKKKPTAEIAADDNPQNQRRNLL
jgi:hypothetical protein